MPSLAAIPDLRHLASLCQLSIYGCECLTSIPSPLPTSLQQLFLSELRALRALPLGDSSAELPQLQQLTLAACDRVAPLPEVVGDLVALQQLAIIGAWRHVDSCRCLFAILWMVCWMEAHVGCRKLLAPVKLVMISRGRAMGVHTDHSCLRCCSLGGQGAVCSSKRCQQSLIRKLYYHCFSRWVGGYLMLRCHA
jgi:hypothetical protein